MIRYQRKYLLKWKAEKFSEKFLETSAQRYPFLALAGADGSPALRITFPHPQQGFWRMPGSGMGHTGVIMRYGSSADFQSPGYVGNGCQA